MNPANTEVVDKLLKIVLFLCGSSMGVFYGFEGWRGSVKNISIKDSPRFKNMVWVLGAGAAAFITDFKAVDKQADRGELLLIYAIGFFAAAFVTIAGWGVVLFFKFWWLGRTRPQSVPPEPFSPIFDYFWYGFAYHHERYEAALEGERRNDFRRYRAYIQVYADQISLAIAAASHAEDQSSARREVAREILKSIRAVVIAYHEKLPNLEINTNYMKAISANQLSGADWERVRFYDKKDKGRYEYFLALSEYAVQQSIEDFILPVENRNNPESARRVLPGAPEAFLKTHYVAVPDTRKITYPAGVPKAIIAEIKSYFEAKTFRSFGSIPIIANGRRVGVVNVDSNELNVFGASDGETEEIVTLLSPFCVLLGQVVTV